LEALRLTRRPVDNSPLREIFHFLLLVLMKPQTFSSTHKFALLVATILFFGGVVFFLHHTQSSAPTDAASRDVQRISDLRQIQKELEVYFDKCGYYPGVAAIPNCGKYAANNTWAGLSAALIGSPIRITSVPNDPTAGANYVYVAMHQGIGYVLGATLEDATNPVLTQSVHGLVNGVNCDSPMYCVQL
jgi:hypothetical protein